MGVIEMGKAISGTVGGDDKRMGNTASFSLPN